MKGFCCVAYVASWHFSDLREMSDLSYKWGKADLDQVPRHQSQFMSTCPNARLSAPAAPAPAAVAFALGEAIELQVMSGFGQTGHRADKAE